MSQPRITFEDTQKEECLQQEFEIRSKQGITPDEFVQAVWENWTCDERGITGPRNDVRWRAKLDTLSAGHAAVRETEMLVMTRKVVHLTHWIRVLTWFMLGFTILLAVIEIAKWFFVPQAVGFQGQTVPVQAVKVQE